MPIEKLRPSFSFDEERIKQLKQIAPEAFADNHINWEVLKEALGNYLEDDEGDVEHFGLFWPGKREARRMASIPSKGTLVPCPGEGIDEENTRNIFIEGENLEVLKILQKSYAGRIKMIYIDPPYNTGNDFVYDDDFTEPLEEYLRRTGQIDEEGKPLTTNKKSDGRFHSRWLSMMYPRLKLARNLLRDDGVIFVSIDDNEVHNLRQIMNEIFGEENFIACMVWQQGRKSMAEQIAVNHEYCVIYSKNKQILNEIKKKESRNFWAIRKEGLDEIFQTYNNLLKSYKNNLVIIQKKLREWYTSLPDSHPSKSHKHYNNVDERGIYFAGDISQGTGKGGRFDIIHPKTKKPVKVPEGGWRFSEDKLPILLNENRIHFGKDETVIPCIKRYLHETQFEVPQSVFYKDGRGATSRLYELLGAKVFEFPKDHEIISRFISFICPSPSDGEIVLDFFAGSGTTAESVMSLNHKDKSKRKYILVQMSEFLEKEKQTKDFKTIADIAKKRIKTVCKNYIKNDYESSDFGVKIFKLNNSNFNNWQNYNGNNLSQLENLFENLSSVIVENINEDYLLTEILLLEGFPLDSKIEEAKEYNKNKVQQVTSDFCEHKLLICLDKKVHSETIKDLQLGDTDIFICLDTAITDEEKVTLADKGLIKTI